jgi:hypothetical protein
MVEGVGSSLKAFFNSRTTSLLKMRKMNYVLVESEILKAVTTRSAVFSVVTQFEDSQMFQRNIVIPSSGLKIKPSKKLAEAGSKFSGDTVLQVV